MVKRKTRIYLSEKERELKNNLENNYKDLAHDALKELKKAVEECWQNKELKEKEYLKYMQMVREYEQKMVGYHH